MKITFIIPGIGLSGGARVVFEYANRLIERGHEVTVVYPLLPMLLLKEPFFSKLKRNLGAIKDIKKGNKISWFDLKARLVRVPTLHPGNVRIVERMIPDADVVVATSWETTYPVSRLSDRKGEKFYFVQQYEIWKVWDSEECWKEAEKIESDPDRVYYGMIKVDPEDESLKEYKKMVEKTYTLPLRKITISTWLKNVIETFGGTVEGTIINGVNFDIFYRDCQDHKNDHVTILMPYRPYKNKGTEDGMKAFEAVKEKYPDTEFIVYGDRRPAELPDWITFYGNVSDDRLRELYSSCDIFVCPSWTEGCQLPPMEASACGCAVVATNVGGVPDYGIDGKTIVAPPPRKPGALTESIIGLIEDGARRKTIAKNGYEHIRQYTWDKATDEFESILKKYSRV
ncbi:glycosyl transferase family 1 [Methanocella sp. CWC-04]|uniref:Glycosyl transferase family 1 n=1 Tax=Methanooceanicella nereidis TaxID=2052831 RepID=A0AAP2W6E1_9EURY|nr:glycosyltransferase family 4 protein [Methanocella sp. CWC-04]MCD1294179.1 glycosyl transferase family 1 [Methanocella sp. CWC-04]